MMAVAELALPSRNEPWLVVQTQPHREARAAAELGKQGFEVFLPRYVRQVRHARRIMNVAAPLFPGYLFLRLCGQTRWRAVNGTVGVIRLIMAGECPAPLAEGVAEGLMARRDASGYIPMPQRQAMRPGEPVRICGGAFEDSLGLFEEVRDADRVAILLDLLGRKVRVVVDEALVDRAA
jgi:transcriptional antiterminator RfaH